MKAIKIVIIFSIISYLLITHQIRAQNDSDDETEKIDDGEDTEDDEEEYSDNNSDDDSISRLSTEKPSSIPPSTTTTTTTTTTAPTTTSTTTETTSTISSTKKPVSTTKKSESKNKSSTSKSVELSTSTTPSPRISTTTTMKTTTVSDEDEESSDEDYENDDKESEKEGAVNNENETKKEDNNGNTSDNEEEDEDYEEEEDNNDYFEELSRDELIRNLLQSYTAVANVTTNSTNKNYTASERWIDLLTTFDNEVQSLIRALTPIALDAFYELNLSPQCTNSLLRFATGLQQQQEWAFNILDSNGHLPIGLFSGTLSSLGAYDQCLETRVIDDDLNTEAFRGQYCLLQLRPPLPSIKGRVSYHKPIISLNGSKFENTWFDKKIAGRYAIGFYSVNIYNAICIPSTCTPQELNDTFQKYAGNNFDVSLGYCDVMPNSITMSVSQIIAVIIILCSVTIAIISSLIELFYSQFTETHRFGRIIRCFSMISNTRKLFHIDSNRSKQSLQFAHGIRVLTMMWIIAIHTFTVGTLFVPMLVYRFEEEARKFGQQLSTQFIYNGYISVSNFFFLSGLVITFITVPLMTKTGGPSFIKFAAMRWLRFIPPLIGTLCFHLLWPLLGSGPIFKEMSDELTKPCSYNWWTNVLFINNWLLLPDMCMVHTWFLSADFQLHVISFFILYTLSRKRSLGLIIVVLMILAGIAIPGYLVYRSGGPPMPLPFNEPKLDQFYIDLNVQYHPTYNHLSPYFIGVLVGYYLTIQNKNLHKLQLSLSIINWFAGILLAVLSLASVYATYLWTGLSIEYSQITASAYAGLHRLAYILIFVWIAIYCSITKDGIITRFLSSPFFIPLSRLSFSVYLVHILVVWYFVLQTRQLIRFTYVNFLYSTGGVLLFSLFFAFILYLLFESVWANLVNLAFKKSPKVNETNNNNRENELKLKQTTTETKSELSINRHFMNAAFTNDNWIPSKQQNAQNGDDMCSATVHRNVYVELGEPVSGGHQYDSIKKECEKNDCIKNTHL